MSDVTPGQALEALAAKWEASADRNQRNGQSLIDQGDEYGNEGLVAADALSACAIELRAAIAARQPQPAPGDAVTRTRLGHALAALREIAEQLDDDPPGTARNALDDDAALRNGSPEQPAPGLTEVAYLYHWRFDRGEEFGLYRHAAEADAKAAEHAGEGLSEVLGMAILGTRPEPQPAPGLPQSAYLYHCKFGGLGGDEYGLFWRKEDADAAAANRAGEGYTVVLGMAILGDRPESQPAAGTCPRCGKPALGTAWRLLDEAREKLALYGEALREVARRTNGYDPGTNEHAVHQVAVSVLALNGVPDDAEVPS